MTSTILRSRNPRLWYNLGMTSHTKTAGHSQNYINHVALVLDASSSMDDHTADVIKVADSQIQHLAKQSQIMDQETRVSVYTFSYKSDIQCLVYDKDVLRLPSIAGLYHPYGMTALCSATTLAIKDLRLTPEKYGEHAFLIYVVTDGFENDSLGLTSRGCRGLSQVFLTIGRSPRSFPTRTQSISLSQSGSGMTTSRSGMLPLTTGSLKSGKSSASPPTRSCRTGSPVSVGPEHFNLNPVSIKDIKALIPLTRGSYTVNKVPQDWQIDEFFAMVTKQPYIAGKTFYQLTKLEEIRSKQVAIRH